MIYHYFTVIDIKSEDSGTFKTIVTFECRGLEVTDFDPRVSTNAKFFFLRSDNLILGWIHSFW